MYKAHSLRPAREDLKAAQQAAVHRLETGPRRLSREQIADLLGYRSRDMLDQVMSSATTTCFPALVHVVLAALDDDLALFGRMPGTTIEAPPEGLNGSADDDEREALQHLGAASLALTQGRFSDARRSLRGVCRAARRGFAELAAADRGASRGRHTMPVLGGRGAKAEPLAEVQR